MQISSPKRLYLIRHGQTLEDPLGPDAHLRDWPLSAKGGAQAEFLAQQFSQIKLSAVFTSTLKRAMQTGDKLAQAQGLSALRFADLNEIPFGFAATTPYNDIIIRYQQLEKDLQTLDLNQIYLNPTLTFLEYTQRLEATLKNIVDHDGEQIAVVAHGGTLLLSLCYCLNLPYHHLMAFYQENCCVNILDFTPPKTCLVRAINLTLDNPLKVGIAF